MTVNQVIRRIQTIALAHKQIRRFRTGLEQDLFADKTAKYPACCLLYNAGSISVNGHTASISFRLLLLDMVHVSEDAKDNQDDVLSDLYSVMMDIVAQIAYPGFNDWKISSDNSMQALIEKENDMLAGWSIDFTIQTIFSQNRCEIPSELFDIEDTGPGGVIVGGNRDVFDEVYIAAGDEGSELDIPALVGKKVLFGTRENNPIYKVNVNPDPAEYIWDNTKITLGVPVGKVGERFLFLYRNY